VEDSLAGGHSNLDFLGRSSPAPGLDSMAVCFGGRPVQRRSGLVRVETGMKAVVLAVHPDRVVSTSRFFCTSGVETYVFV
jgi:hypothetical protein